MIFKIQIQNSNLNRSKRRPVQVCTRRLVGVKLPLSPWNKPLLGAYQGLNGLLCNMIRGV
ncbi:hypothetical protein HanXRQr2_Chr11g0469521 [Helianthus annuus]|uniref:Uncharacterized protein n=1 Tax=Helianthus annuus TaxID=4232 RepID=A0A251UAF9_HELAN|nr:hypothetical protein HanXRQr2_Chr11g0469521 [Helianthus annuus]